LDRQDHHRRSPGLWPGLCDHQWAWYYLWRTGGAHPYFGSGNTDSHDCYRDADVSAKLDANFNPNPDPTGHAFTDPQRHCYTNADSESDPDANSKRDHAHAYPEKFCNGHTHAVFDGDANPEGDRYQYSDPHGDSGWLCGSVCDYH
jgi:hypothetical protein